jgi:hypothetical protein
MKIQRLNLKKIIRRKRRRRRRRKIRCWNKITEQRNMGYGCSLTHETLIEAFGVYTVILSRSDSSESNITLTALLPRRQM